MSTFPSTKVAPPSVATVSIVIEAALNDVWAIVGDPEQLAGCSPEVASVDAPVELVVGAVFTGHNASDGNEWSVPCEIVAYDAPHLFAFHAGDDEVGTTWSFALRDLGEAGTQVIQTFDSLRLRHPDWIEMLAGRHAQLVQDMQTTLAAVKDQAEATAVVS